MPKSSISRLSGIRGGQLLKSIVLVKLVSEIGILLCTGETKNLRITNDLAVRETARTKVSSRTKLTI